MSAAPPETPAGDEDLLVTIHRKVTAIGEDLAVIKERCGGCQPTIRKHDQTLYGNGQPGLVGRVATLESGRTDTLSVKSLVILIGAMGTLCSAIGAAVASIAR